MEKNRLFILAGVLAVLVLIAYFLTKSDQRSSTDKISTKIYEFDSAAVDMLEIMQDGKKIAMKNNAGTWELVEPVNYKVNQEFIGAVLSDLKNYQVLSIVSKNPENKKDFGLDDSAKVTVSVYQSGNLVGSFDIGKTPDAPNQTYIKVPDKDEIYLAKNFLKNNFVRPTLESWRDLRITSIPATSVNLIQYETPSGSYTVTKDSTGKYYIDGAPADSGVVAGVLNILQDFNTQTFKDTVLGPETQYTDKVKVTWGGNSTDLNFLKQGDSLNVNYLLKVSGNDQVFLFNEALGKNVIKTKTELSKK